MGLAAAITTVVAAGGGGFGRGFSPASYGICGSREIPSLNRPLKCSNRIGKLRRRERPPYLRVKCFVNGKEDRKTIGDVSREDSSENGAHEGKRNAVILAEEEGTSDEKWQPPWMNIPQRYKLIGATSLAFVICNMDKPK